MTEDLKQIKKVYNIIGRSAGLERALNVALKVAPTDLNVLIEGESGVGKEVFSRLIHDNSQRKRNSCLALNCGSIPEGTIDSELFGHEKGSFTDASREHAGYFETANNGTLFLDEVGELPLSTQARLLRVLEKGEYMRVGSSEVRKTNVRIVAATNVNLRKAITEGRFREDLYYRLCVIPIFVPPLRDRAEDIPLLFKKFAMDIAVKINMPPVRLADEEAEQALMAYKWPGNIRQLKNFTEQISALEIEREITAEVINRYIPVSRDTREIVAGDNVSSSDHTYESERVLLFNMIATLTKKVAALESIIGSGNSPEAHTVHALGYMSQERGEGFEEAEEVVSSSIRDTERQQIIKTLEKNNQHRRAAAKELGISERTLYRKIKEYGLE